jgi:hypothetical protein
VPLAASVADCVVVGSRALAVAVAVVESVAEPAEFGVAVELPDPAILPSICCKPRIIDWISLDSGEAVLAPLPAEPDEDVAVVADVAGTELSNPDT